VFTGGCTLEAAEAVCGAAGPEAGGPDEADVDVDVDVVGGLAALVDGSLLQQAEDADGGPRFSMLETIREYALDQLERSGEAAPQRRRHADHFAAVAAQVGRELRGPDQAAWMARLAQDLDNYRGAIRWALSAGGAAGPGHPELAAGIVGSLFFLWYRRGLFTEARRWLAAVLATGDRLPQAHQARAHGQMATFAAEQGDYDLARSAGETSLALHRALGNQPGAASALGNLAWLELSLGNEERAAALSEETLAVFRALGDQHNVAICLNRLGRLARDRGDFAQAETYLQEALALRRQLGDRRGIGSVLESLADVAFETGDLAAAERLLREVLTIARDVDEREGLPSYLSGLARAAASAGEPLRAARLWGAAAALRDALGAPIAPKDVHEYQQRVEAARAQGDPTAFGVAWAEGQTMSLEQAVASALGDASAST
jgi:tetratricopeptide (TPR) repeat protein